MMLPLVLPAGLWPTLPGVLAGVAAVAALSVRSRRLLLLLLPALLTSAVIGARLGDRLASVDAGRVFTVEGVVEGLPLRLGDLLEFRFRVLRHDPAASVPRRLRVRWYRTAPALAPGQRWLLTLRLQPPRGRVNFQGPDPERSHFARGIGALATVVAGPQRRLDGSTHRGLHPLRHELRQRLQTLLGDAPAAGVVVALAIGDRGSLSDLHRETLMATGTGHLLAISGLHVGLSATAGYYLASLLCSLLPHRWQLRRGRALRWVGSLTVAVAYAGLAGFGVSTRRALIMLLTLAALRLSRRHAGLMAPWSLALIACLALAPLSPLEPGFWLSFAAVMTLLWRFGPLPGGSRRPGRLALAQVSIVLVMLPLGLFWFQHASAAGLVANLFAIPVVSFFVVPLVLAGLALLAAGLSAWSGVALTGAAWGAEVLLELLGKLATLPAAWPSNGVQPSFPAVLLATLGGLALLTPRRLGLGLLAGLLMLPVWLPAPARAPTGSLRVELLDVGQGLAAVVSSPERLLLYDTGPGLPGQWDLVRPVILPAVRHAGFAWPDLIVVGHGDHDHAGGLPGVRAAFPQAAVSANLRARHGSRPCDTRLQPDWSPLAVKTLHPTPWLPYLGNTSSCVLSLVLGTRSLLLPGDIDEAVERRLVQGGLTRHDLVVVPHHGSATSSSRPFVAALSPQIALIAAGAGNRFGFPKTEVVARYRASGARVLSVSDCGAVRVHLQPDGETTVTTARRARSRLWRWPAAGTCP